MQTSDFYASQFGTSEIDNSSEIYVPNLVSLNENVRNEAQFEGAVDFLINNFQMDRQQIMKKLFEPRRDIDEECGYAKALDITQYLRMYLREGVAKRVVNIYPDESWAKEPEVFEDANSDTETGFEGSWKRLHETLDGPSFASTEDRRTHKVFSICERADRMAGIGTFGVMLIGLNDGRPLESPARGIDENGMPSKTDLPKDVEVPYISTFHQGNVKIVEIVDNMSSRRHGLPQMYEINFDGIDSDAGDLPSVGTGLGTRKVHWSRIIHVADNLTTSKVFGTPRLESVWNRLMDIQKILGGSAESYWKGGFPGISLETQPGLDGAEIDITRVRQMMFDYMNGMQRFLAMGGLSAKTLDSQIADPSKAFDIAIKAICITISTPYRIFVGTEEAKLAGQQDDTRWNRRLMRRQVGHLSPHLIHPLIDRLILLGALARPAPDRGFTCKWPNLMIVSDEDAARIANIRTDALVKYIQGEGAIMLPPLSFFTEFLGIDEQKARDFIKEAENLIAELETSDTDIPGRLKKEEFDLEGGFGIGQPRGGDGGRNNGSINRN